MNHLFYVVLGILGGTLTGSIGYGIWLLLSREAAKFTVKYEMVYLRIVQYCYLVPLVVSVIYGFITDTDVKDVESWFDTTMIVGLLLLVIAWAVSVVGVGISYYNENADRGIIRFGNDPIHDPEIVAMAEAWKKKLKVHKKFKLYYNDVVTSPGIIYSKGYQILIPKYGMSKKEINLALLHELTHLKHDDIVTRFLAYVVNALYAFNPLTKKLRKETVKWAEVSCDWACCQLKGEDVTGKEYFRSILNLKIRTSDDPEISGMYSLFEDRDMFEYRVDMMLGRKSARPHVERVLMAGVLLVFVMLISIPVSLKGIELWRGKTMTYVAEKADSPEVVEVTEASLFTDMAVNYIDEDIVNHTSSTDFTLPVDTARVYDLSNQNSESVVVNIICNDGAYECGCIVETGQILHLESEDSTIIPLEMSGEEIDQFFIMNVGDSDCQVELFLKVDSEK
ncbi:MAG: M56 family metallopeptidase [Lachnospiraceae bacterium]|nr:M56 family metallopeptidase [Lachnospiraceae bacterium]